MKVKELIEKLNTLDPEIDIYIAVRKGYRPVGNLQPIETIDVAFVHDTAKTSYLIDIDIEPAYRFDGTEKSLPEHKTKSKKNKKDGKIHRPFSPFCCPILLVSQKRWR